MALPEDDDQDEVGEEWMDLLQVKTRQADLRPQMQKVSDVARKFQPSQSAAERAVAAAYGAIRTRASAPVSSGPLPASRAERLRQRAKNSQAPTRASTPPSGGPPRNKAAAVVPQSTFTFDETEDVMPEDGFEEDDLVGDVSGPTEEEELSASTFLAAVKSRLTDWGKVDQYHEFVIALSGSVDVKNAVRILRGHDDLIHVFQRKFAPRVDIRAMKEEMDQEDQPRPPSTPPPWKVTPSNNTSNVKRELMARPPSQPPKMSRRS